MGADDDALGERLVHGHGEPAAQCGSAEQEQAIPGISAKGRPRL